MRGASGEILDDFFAGHEGFESVGGTVDVEGNVAGFDVARETGAVGEAGAANRGPERAFDSVEVGLSDH